MLLAEWAIDWFWVSSLLVSTGGLWFIKLQREVDALKEVHRLASTPWPSDASEEYKEVVAAQAAARRRGIDLTFKEAMLICAQIRSNKRKKKAAQGGTP